jgi:hypothetical protein
VWESDIGQHKNPGTRIIPLTKKLQRWKGHRFFVMIPYVGVPIDEYLLESHVTTFANTPLKGWRGLARFLFPPVGALLERTDVVCSELVYQCLMDVEVVRPDWPWRFCPGDFLHMERYTLQDRDYGPPMFFYF